MASSDLKYELISCETRQILGQPLYRIRAIRSIPAHDVAEGDLGGFVQSEANLSHRGNAWIAGDAMAVQHSRVEDDALATDHATLSDFATLCGSARMSRLSRADGQAIIRGQAQMTDAASAHDSVILDGQILVGSGFALTGNGSYQERADVPLAMAQLDPKSPAYQTYLDECVEIDPAVHRAFAALGVVKAQDREKAVAALQRTREGKAALTGIMRAVGGTFYPTAYHALDGRAVAAKRAADVVRHSYSCRFTNCRFVAAIGAVPFHDAESGDPSFAAVLKAIKTDEADTLFQAAILTDQTPETALTPLPPSMRIHPETYTSLLDAQDAALTYLADAFEEQGPDRPLAGGPVATGTGISVLDLPIVIEVEACADGVTRLVMMRGTYSDPNSYKILSAEPDFLDEFDFKHLSADPLESWHDDQNDAAEHAVTLKLILPTPSRRVLNAIRRAFATTPPKRKIIMKRDMDLVRSILLEIEKNQQINGQFVISDADIMGGLQADRTTVQYHLRLLMDAGYVEGKDLLRPTDAPNRDRGDTILIESGTPISISRLSWDGHEFLDTVRDNKVWNKTKGYLKDLGGVSIDVLKDVAKAVVKDQINQYTGLSLS